MNLETLIRTVATSIKRNGADKPLTLGHLHNLLKMVQRLEERRSAQAERDHHVMLQEFDPLGQEGMWG